MTGPKRARCPSCRKPVETEVAKRPVDFPFCSERCRMLDLSKWFNGEFRIASNAPSAPDIPQVPEDSEQ